MFFERFFFSALILRGLDALTTEDTIRHTIPQLTNFTIKNVHIARDRYTNISNGFAFIEFNSIQESSVVLNFLQTIQPCFELDGKQVNVDYSKNNYSTAYVSFFSLSV